MSAHPVVTDHGPRFYEALAKHDVPRKPHRKTAWLNFGTKLAAPCVGCVVVFWRGDIKGWSGHVGFVVGKDKLGNLMVLGGNQGDMVSIKPFIRSRVLGYRWPTSIGIPELTLPLLASGGRVSTNEA